MKKEYRNCQGCTFGWCKEIVDDIEIECVPDFTLLEEAGIIQEHPFWCCPCSACKTKLATLRKTMTDAEISAAYHIPD